MRKVLLAGLLCFSPAAFAGWVSGGGEVVRDATNPWFLANTPTATYCIAVASQGFPYGADQIQPIITSVLDYWRREFAKSMASFPAGRVATQRFQLIDCGANPDIAFQFGFLTNAQLKVISAPRDYISLAMRTDYDPVTLRGRGFIYVAAEEGPFRPASDKLMDHPWQDCDGCRLKRVLAHEVGHVFGLPHITTDDLNLMAPEYPENMTSKTFSGDIPTASTPLPPFFAHDANFIYSKCEDPRFPHSFDAVRNFFQVPSKFHCAALKSKNDAYSIVASAAADAEFEEIGSIEELESEGEVPYVVRVHLTTAQHVFPGIALELPYVGSGAIERDEISGLYHRAGNPDATASGVLIHITPHGVELDGLRKDGTIQRQLIIGTKPY